MRVLYLFPHPDDESFGPAATIHAQLAAGHEVFLYTFTRGGATRVRHKLGLSVAQMGEVRYQEMQDVARVLGLTGMRVDDFPDGELAHVDPRPLERAIADHVRDLRPQVLITYPVYGISGYHDHLVTHAAVKRVFLELRDQGADYLRRLAFLALPDSDAPTFVPGGFRIRGSAPGKIDCTHLLGEADLRALRAALNCYPTYQDTIRASGVLEKVGDRNHFEFFGETFDPPLGNVLDQLP